MPCKSLKIKEDQRASPRLYNLILFVFLSLSHLNKIVTSMKQRLSLLFLLFAICSLFSLSAQTVPQGISYQSLVRDAAGNALANQTVTLLFSVRSGAPNGPVAYSEKQTLSTNEFGLV